MSAWKQAYYKTIRELADSAWCAYMRNPCQTLYLFGRFDGTAWNNLVVADETAWAELVLSDYIPRSLTNDALAQWFDEQLRRTPLALVRDAA